MSGHLIEQTACGLLSYRQIFRYAATLFFQHLLKYSRTKIIGDKDAIGSGVHVKDLFGGLKGVGFAEITYEHESGIIGQPVVCQGLLVSFQTSRVYITREVGR